MAKKSYFEKLKDPRWQRKRLEKMQQQDFVCEGCYDSQSTLHVHHKIYFKGREPWEYDLDQLALLCESCHESEHENDTFMDAVSRLPYDGPGNRDLIEFFIRGVLGLNNRRPEHPAAAIAFILGWEFDGDHYRFVKKAMDEPESEIGKRMKQVMEQ